MIYEVEIMINSNITMLFWLSHALIIAWQDPNVIGKKKKSLFAQQFTKDNDAESIPGQSQPTRVSQSQPPGIYHHVIALFFIFTRTITPFVN